MRSDFSLFGFRFWRFGEELQVNSASFLLHGGMFVSALVLTGDETGSVVLVPEDSVRQQFIAEPAPSPIVTTCSETINGDPSTALRLSFQIRVF